MENTQMNKQIFNEGGFLSEVGKLTFQEVLDQQVKDLLAQAKNENQIRLIGSLIQNRVGELIANAVSDKKK